MLGQFSDGAHAHGPRRHGPRPSASSLLRSLPRRPRWEAALGPVLGGWGGGLPGTEETRVLSPSGRGPPLPARGARRPRGRAVGSCEYRRPSPAELTAPAPQAWSGGNVLPTVKRQAGRPGGEGTGLGMGTGRPQSGSPAPTPGSFTSSTKHVGRPLSGEQAEQSGQPRALGPGSASAAPSARLRGQGEERPTAGAGGGQNDSTGCTVSPGAFPGLGARMCSA